ncbi:DUF5605 domain-containing protein [Microbacterium sp. M28]|uniref:DUF5605 domain-containing protein n=1 Tax=Microbacterium sp. M28 TaxID=2962064 RepID=UPI0021F436A9|nr:DUF5605 domain-containing protein [Microbacterium sp. M28]UYO96550.1 DUF5605 domain-containing protein [Microbacterium sp. M28]
MTPLPAPTTAVSGEESVNSFMRNPHARAILERHMPELQSLSSRLTLGGHSLRLVAKTSPALKDEAAIDALFLELSEVPGDDRPAEPIRTASPAAPENYDPEGLPASATVTYPRELHRFERFEVVFAGPQHGNPFTDVTLALQMDTPSGRVEVPGFYDGDGVYRVRFLAENPGLHRFESVSNARSMNGISGEFEVSSAAAGRGPVRVQDRFHFAHADGTRYSPVGTTAYAWTHQGGELEERTLTTLASAPFNKIRMCVFPKSYAFNENEPALYPFVGDPDAGFDLARFDLRYWEHLEHRIAQLDALGIEADIILFHPYDRWGFADMGLQADDRYLRYAVARLAGFANVWWSLANEYDLLPTKTETDWERFASIVQESDPTGHLLSIHNCFDFYDYSREWITHASVQRRDIYKTAEMTDQWRQAWGKPVVIDECAYEGDLDQGWGNITGEEMVRRFWEGAVRGGYVGHGETYLRENDEIWWAKGGELVGSSPARIAFLRKIMEAAPFGLEPVAHDWDIPSAGIPGRYMLFYYGFNQPRFRRFLWDPETEYTVDVIDTWNMTIQRLPGHVTGRFTIDLPGRPYMALRFQAVDQPTT